MQGGHCGFTATHSQKQGKKVTPSYDLATLLQTHQGHFEHAILLFIVYLHNIRT